MLLSFLLHFYILFFVFFFFIFINHKKHRKYINQLIHNLYICTELLALSSASLLLITVGLDFYPLFCRCLILVNIFTCITFKTHNSHNNNEEVSTVVVIKVHNNWLTNQTHCFLSHTFFSFMAYYRSSLHNCNVLFIHLLIYVILQNRLSLKRFQKGESFILFYSSFLFLHLLSIFSF